MNLLVPNPTVYATGLIDGKLNVSNTAGATYTTDEGYNLAVQINDDGIIIDLHTDESGNPASLSMSWDEWAEYLLEHGVR